MILPHDINPNRSLYVMGSRIIEAIRISNAKVIDPKVLFYKYKNIFREENELTYNYFLYALDWLFLIGYIKLNKKSKIVICF